MEWIVGSDLDAAGKPPSRLDISVEVAPKRWLNVSAVPPAAPSVMWPMIWAGALAAVLVAMAAIWAAGRVARPIAGLTTAAERMGRGDGLVLAPEEGPQDVKAAAAAFNTMAARLRRMIEDQRALLSAVGHDLRTRVSSLRIRTELVKDPELQTKMRGSIEEMERLMEATLAAARGGESGARGCFFGEWRRRCLDGEKPSRRKQKQASCLLDYAEVNTNIREFHGPLRFARR